MKKSKFTVLVLLINFMFIFSFNTSADDLDFNAEYYKKFETLNITLNVYNWGQYISDGSDDSYDTISEFENLTGIKVNYSQYASNEELYSKLKGGGADYDIIIPSDYMIARMIDEDMLEKLNFANIPTFINISDEFKKTSYDPTGEYSVPYTWGTVVLIYNTKYVTEDVDSWDLLWNDKYKGKIIMFQNSRDSFGIALKKLGYSMNTTVSEELDKAAEELKIQKPLVQGYFMDEIFDKLENNSAYIAPYYAGDALNMIDANPDLAAIYPKEGTNRFIDSMCIPKGSKNKEAAEMFINFMNEAYISKQNCEFTEYCTPNELAFNLLDDQVKNNLIKYPSAEILAKTENFIHLPYETNQKIDELWREVLSSSDLNIFLFPIILIILIGAAVVVIIRNKKNKKSY